MILSSSYRAKAHVLPALRQEGMQSLPKAPLSEASRRVLRVWMQTVFAQVSVSFGIVGKTLPMGVAMGQPLHFTYVFQTGIAQVPKPSSDIMPWIAAGSSVQSTRKISISHPALSRPTPIGLMPSKIIYRQIRPQSLVASSSASTVE